MDVIGQTNLTIFLGYSTSNSEKMSTASSDTTNALNTSVNSSVLIVTDTNTPRSYGPQIKSIEHLIVTSVILGLMILATIIGNVFVIAAVVLEKNLHNVANYLILSLAVADLMVATLVMPISIVDEISEVWFLRAEVCSMWISFDVLCCTASILHLVAISVDRYWAFTKIDYIRNRSASRILLMIATAWFVGLCISIAPLFGWKDSDNDPVVTGNCVISQNVGYTIFSTGVAFYVPTIVMLIIYAKIYQVARARIRKKNFMKKNSNKQKNSTASKNNLLGTPTINGHSELTVDETSFVTEVNNDSDKNDNSKISRNGNTDDSKLSMLPKTSIEAAKAKKNKDKIEMRRERKAARTLGIITGAYIVCWLPFFIIALFGPLTKAQIPKIVASIVLWLGYVNSLLNPIIYTIFSPEFRNAFRKILFGKYSNRRR